MAAKHGAQSRLNAANAAMAAVPPPSMVAKPCHRAGSVSPASPKLVENAHRGNHVLLGDEPRDGRDGGLPISEAKRSEHPRQEVAQGSHEAVVQISVHLGVEQTERTFVETEVHEEPNDDGGKEDDGTGFDDVAAHALPRGQEHRLDRGQVVGRKLHDERGDLPRKGAELLQHDAADDDGSKAQEVEQGCDPPRRAGVHAHERAEHQRDDGHLRTAGIIVVVMTVMRRSFSFSMVLVAMTAGTPQPLAMSMGMKLLPESPKRRKMRSITNATRAR